MTFCSTSLSERAEAFEPLTRHLEQEDPLFTPGEVALWLRVTTDVLSKWRQRSAGPAFITLPSGGVRYRKADLRAWAASRKGVVLPLADPVRSGGLIAA